MTRPLSFSLDTTTLPSPVAGVDEAGRGPWAGPVVAAAVIFRIDIPIPRGIGDSKKLPRQRRETLYPQILLHDVGVGIASVEEIDRLNIRRANHLAMQRAVSNLSAAPKTIVVDGNDPVAFDMSEAHIVTVVGGDGKVLAISAASIVAKVTRDRLMAELALECPDYGWATNQGYGTAVHAAALEKFGVTSHHRRTFAPIRRLIDQDR